MAAIYFEVVRYPEPVRGGHKVYTVRSSSGELCGVWNPKRSRLLAFSSLALATAWADTLNGGLSRAAMDGCDVGRAGERFARRSVVFPASGEAGRRVVPALSDKATDTAEELARKAAERQALRRSGAWWAFGYTMDAAGVVTVPIMRDVRALAALE